MASRSILINLPGLLLGSPSRLKNIVRFSNSHRIQDESVAEHSFSTALYCLVIGEELREGGLNIDVEMAVVRALIHDIEESHSGDFIRTFKHSSKELAGAIEKASEQFARKLFKEMSPECHDMLFQRWRDAKDASMEGKLVEFADFLSVVSYVLREVRMGNKALLSENAESMGEYANRFQLPRYDFLRPYVREAATMLFQEIRQCPK